MELIGEPELVFDWSAGHCPVPNAPDLPVRPFRDAGGLIHVNLSAPNNYSLVGPDFDHLDLDCNPTLVSGFDPDPSHFNYSEWIGATYTLDGNTVYAIVHDEYYGYLGSQWDSLRDFGDQQGGKDWSYNAWTGSAYRPMTYDPTNDRWQGPRTYCQLANWGQHPDGACEPARTWTSPVSGSVLVHGAVYDAAPEQGDGVIVSIYKNEDLLWSLSIDANDPDTYPFSIPVDVVPGDALYFRVNQRASLDFDSTNFRVKIDQGPDPCPSGEHERCFYADLTYAVSTDGGSTFTQPSPPDNLIAAPPNTYTPEAGQYAMWQPSNIVLNPDDNYYYALVARIYAPYNHGGHINAACVMRTQTLDEPSSWRAWDGEGFNLAMPDPYTTPGLSPSADACTIVEPFGLTYSLTYNTYLGAFIATGHGYSPTLPRTGFYFTLSTDLVHWSRPQLIMPADFVNTTDGPYLAYPSLVDTGSQSLSFDTTGQDVYLYYSLFNDRSLDNTDLLRLPLHFEK